MGTKPRLLGADVRAIGVTETTYGTAPTDGCASLYLRTSDLDSERPLGLDPLLGTGRDGLDPYYEAVSVNGAIEIPIDVQAFGFWLHGLLGAPTTTPIAATGEITFSGPPAANSTITLNGTVWTFVASGATGNRTNIGANLDATLTQLATDLNASADVEVAKCTYTANTALDRLEIVHDTAGVAGNTYTLAASATSNGTVSAATLLGGGFQHVFTAGGATPSKTIEIGHPELTTPRYYRFLGCNFGSLSFDMGRTGPANASVNVIAQNRATAASSIDATPTAYTLTRFARSNGTILKSGTQLALVTAGRFEFTNSPEAVETIRADGLIDGVDMGEARASGSITVRESVDTALEDAIAAQTPVALTYHFTHPLRWSLAFALPRVFLPKAKAAIRGPGGIEQSFDWQGAKDPNEGYHLRVTLKNNVASYTG